MSSLFSKFSAARVPKRDYFSGGHYFLKQPDGAAFELTSSAEKSDSHASIAPVEVDAWLSVVGREPSVPRGTCSAVKK